VRSRLLTVVLSLVALVLLGLGIPLASSLAGGEQQGLFLDRLTMTARLASLVQRPLLDGHPETVAPVLQRYDDVYGVRAVVLDQDGVPGAWTRTAPTLSDPTVQADLNVALAGRQPERVGVLLPWQNRPLVLAEPVMVDGEVRGAVVTVSPTDALRGRMLALWAAVLVGGLLALGLAVLLALPVVRWILRPVRRLEEATGRVATAVIEGAPCLPVEVDTGPPELRKLARSFDDMATSVSDAFAAQRAFVADASHQLRNPLTALHIRLSNLDGMITPDGVEDYAAAVAENRRLRAVLDELLALARTESGADELVVTEVSAVLDERVDAWRAVAAARDIELRLDAPDGLDVLAAPRAVDATLDALLDNALKFTAGHDRADASVEVTARREGDGVIIAVRDHGPGLEPAELARATDRFWRGARHQNVSGSGLGLAIVRRIVERSGGSLRLDLPDGGGLRVSIELPAAPDHGEVAR
jgi:signal transduction histidine kinase